MNRSLVRLAMSILVVGAIIPTGLVLVGALWPVGSQSIPAIELPSVVTTNASALPQRSLTIAAKAPSYPAAVEETVSSDQIVEPARKVISAGEANAALVLRSVAEIPRSSPVQASVPSVEAPPAPQAGPTPPAEPAPPITVMAPGSERDCAPASESGVVSPTDSLTPEPPRSSARHSSIRVAGDLPPGGS
ncbi:MAG: hypothetical protein ACYDHP_06400 [Ferrimicrobium sp.]